MQTQMQQDRAKTRSAKFSEVMHPSSLNYLESDFFYIWLIFFVFQVLQPLTNSLKIRIDKRNHRLTIATNRQCLGKAHKSGVRAKRFTQHREALEWQRRKDEWSNNRDWPRTRQKALLCGSMLRTIWWSSWQNMRYTHPLMTARRHLNRYTITWCLMMTMADSYSRESRPFLRTSLVLHLIWIVQACPCFQRITHRKLVWTRLGVVFNLLLVSNPYKSNGSSRSQWAHVVMRAKNKCLVDAYLLRLKCLRCKASTVSPRRRPVHSWLPKKVLVSITNESPTQAWPTIDFLRCFSVNKTTQTWMEAELHQKFHQCRTRLRIRAGWVLSTIATSWCSLTYNMLRRRRSSARCKTLLIPPHQSSKTSSSITPTRTRRTYHP